jgi:hypothetical protein
MFSPLKTTSLAIAALCLFGGGAKADPILGASRPVQASAAKRTYEPVLIQKRIDGSTPNARPGTATELTGAAHTQQIMLLPAVQKVREAAARL